MPAPASRPSRRTHRAALLVAVATTGALVLAACDKSSSTSSSGSGASGSASGPVTLTIASNSIAGGKNSDEANWFASYVIPKFTEMEKAKGVDVTVKFQPSGVDDEQYKAKLALDLKSHGGADVMALDGIWVGEFAQAGYIKPLDELVGDTSGWDGWSQIPKAVQANASFDGKVYGVPGGTDGRVLYFNKKLFAQAGLPTDWQPRSWQDIIDAGTRLKAAGVPSPVQIDAGTAMGEATTMQGFLPLLAGAGQPVFADDRWTGSTQAFKDVLTFYKTLLDQGLMDKNYQQAAKGRDQSFAAFAQGKIGIIAEGDYMWRSVINPKGGDAPMATRDSDVGWAFIPAKTPGKGIKGQDYVSYSGGGGTFVNPNSKNPRLAWELVQLMASKDAVTALQGDNARITARQDVNTTILAKDPFLSFVSQKVLPVTTYRPGLAQYPQVSQAIQQATADIVSGKSVDDAAAAYEKSLEGVVGADKVTKS